MYKIAKTKKIRQMIKTTRSPNAIEQKKECTLTGFKMPNMQQIYPI